MKMGTKIIALLGFLVVSYIVGLLFFTKGFLLVRTMVLQNSSCEVEFAARADDLVHGGHNGCWSHARFKRAIVVIIDALRYDFMTYDASLKSEAPPFKNKMKTVHQMLSKRPRNTRLYKFIADPPTTTMQRLKGLTTGSLPTFVDAGANFDSSEIREDNWIDQLIAQGKDVKFFGDDTWNSLFPNRFYKSFPFPSFNVKDLHTVDNGILKHLYPEIRRRDWDVAIAHFLGVDHCGHRFGPSHPAMGEKLQQMDQMIWNITQLMREDTVLFVLGDHGMTHSGDHGGDSEDELTAALFVYSPAQITASEPSKEDRVVHQTDLVPTLSLLLGVPIPFSNLGTVIPDLFNHCPWWDTFGNEIRQVFHTVKALHLNALQVSTYLTTYANTSSDLPADRFLHLQQTLRQAETELQSLVTGVTSGTGSPDLLQRLTRLSERYRTYLAQVRAMCQQVWAKFDLTSMALGIVMVMGCLAVNGIVAVCWTGEGGEELPSYLPFMLGGIAMQGAYYAIHTSVFPPSVLPIMGYVIGGVLVFAASVVLRKKAGELLCTSSDVLDACVAAVAAFMYFAALFSNSFVVYEDSVTHFLSQSLLWFMAVRIIVKSFRALDPAGKDGKLFRKSRQSYGDILEKLTQPAVVTFVVTLCCSLLLRTSANFRVCREEQHSCEAPSFLQSLSSFGEDDSGYKNQRYFFSVLCLCATVWSARRWLQHYGNLNGDGINVLCTKFLLPLATVACSLYWAIQALPPKELDGLPPWQQTIMAQIVYVCIIIHVVTGVLQPLYVYIHRASGSGQVSVPLVNRGVEQTVPYVYRQLQQHWHHKDIPDEPPAAYGLGSVYSSHLVAFTLALFLLLVLLLGDGVSPSLTLAMAVLFLFLEITAAYSTETSASEGLKAKPVPWLTVVTHGLLSSAFFYATGHQATIPSIRFQSAFVGFHGDFATYAIPATLITLNTFAGPLLFTAVSPLMLMWPCLRGPLSGWMVGVGRRARKEKEEKGAGEGEGGWKGDFAVFDDGVMLRKALCVSLCRVLFFQGVKVLGAACAAGLHRRHLMVWKIFAPRFVFEAVSLMVVSAALLVMMLIVLRVDHALSRLTKDLQKRS